MASRSVSFSRLERVDVRSAWVSEASHFTPWLAQPENLALLGEAIGLELELEAQEKRVGPFRADILCKNTGDDTWVLIENQLERTDHSHLGQLLTYAAGLKAVTIAWIACPFTEEHRAALDWLNEITDSRFNFFGLEIELWRIADSPVAPKFNVVSKPNDWSKTVAEAAAKVESAELTAAKSLQLRFWTAFREYVAGESTRLRPSKPKPSNWMGFSIGRSGFHLAAVANLWDTETRSYDNNELRTELVITAEEAKPLFLALEMDRSAVDAELGGEVVWHNPESARMCRIYVRRTCNLYDEAEWPDQHRWLLQNLERFHRVFAPRVRMLDPSGISGESLTS